MLFCRPSELQLELYQRTLQSKVVRSCLCANVDGSHHLVCIGVLKQLCNHPVLVRQKAIVAKNSSGQNEKVCCMSPHLVCIEVLKQLCNHPIHVRQKAVVAKNSSGQNEKVCLLYIYFCLYLVFVIFNFVHKFN